MLAKNLQGAAAAAVPAYIEDVFSTYLYTGTGSDQTLTTGVDLSTYGGMIWSKRRSAVENHFLQDTNRGLASRISSNTTGAASTTGAWPMNAISTTGMTVSGVNYAAGGETYVSWTFRKQPKFFDVVTFTSSASGNKTFNHNLGSTPGCVIIKNTQTADPWIVYHRSVGDNAYLQLNSTAVQDPLTGAFSVSSTQVTISSSLMYNSQTYVAYLFAHDAGGFGDAGSDNVIKCGSFTTDGSGNATVSLGYEPQWLITKTTGIADDWYMADIMRGWTTDGAYNYLLANTSGAESSVSGSYRPTATGFVVANGGASRAYIYIAIRRGPMKTPEAGTEVFTPTVYTGTNADNRLLDTTIAPDMVWIRQRNDTVLGGMVVGDRLRGQPYLLTGTTAAEVNDADAFDKQIVSTTEYGTAFSSMNGVWIGNDATAKLNVNTTADNHIVEAFQRAPGFFDVVCYTGTGANRTVSHNLGVAPELIIGKNRTNAVNWSVYSAPVGNTAALSLNLSDAPETGSWYWNNTTPTNSVFTLGDGGINLSGDSFVAYLFASCPGVSKVGSYTGNGSSQTINCNFTNGARFILIKRTDSTGDWYVYDSARGIVSGNDPQLKLNSTAAEATGFDAIDPDNSGFIVNNNATNFPINVNNATYIYLAIA